MKNCARHPKTLVVGLGNELLMDDGVGVHAVRALFQELPSEVRLAEIGTAVLTFLDDLDWAERILAIDAMDAGGPSGAVFITSGQNAERAKARVSMHELGLFNAYALLPRKTPPEILVVGVQPKTIDYGIGLTPEVEASLPKVVETVKKLVSAWPSAGGELAQKIGLNS